MKKAYLIGFLTITAVSCAYSQKFKIDPVTSLHPAGVPILLEITISNTAIDPVLYDLGIDSRGKIVVSEGDTVYKVSNELGAHGFQGMGEKTLVPGKTQTVFITLDDWVTLDQGRHDLRISLDGQRVLPAEFHIEVTEPTTEVLEAYTKELIARTVSTTHITWRQLHMLALGKLLSTDGAAQAVLQAEIAKNPKLGAQIARAQQMESSRLRAID